MSRIFGRLRQLVALPRRGVGNAQSVLAGALVCRCPGDRQRLAPTLVPHRRAHILAQRTEKAGDQFGGRIPGFSRERRSVHPAVRANSSKNEWP
jgi:hypothetical protein